MTTETKMRICRNCRCPENEHCTFDPVSMPEGCACDPFTWGDLDNVSPICAAHIGDPQKNCERCEHNIECHPAQGGGAP